MTRSFVFGACVLALLLPSCRSPLERSFGLDGWQQARVAGFTLLTNLQENRARVAAGWLAAYAGLIDASLGGEAFTSERERVVFLFATREQFAHYGSILLGHAAQSDDVVRVGMSAELGFATASVLFHELVHVALYEDARIAYPAWYHEGLAEMLGSASIRENVATLGALPPDRAGTLAAHPLLPLERIFDVKRALALEPDETVRFYADAWVVVRFLHGGLGAGEPDHRDALATFLGRLRDGGDWRPAFDASFPVSLAELERQVEDFRARVVRGGSPVVHVRIDAEPVDASFSPLPAREIGLELARYAEHVGRLGLALRFYEELVRRDPTDADAQLARGRIQAEIARLEEAAVDEEAAAE